MGKTLYACKSCSISIKAAWVYSASAVHTRPARGRCARSALATGISLVFSSIQTCSTVSWLSWVHMASSWGHPAHRCWLHATFMPSKAMASSGWSTSVVWIVAFFRGDETQAAASYQEGLTLARELGDKRFLADGLNNLGYLTFLQDDLVKAAAMTQGGTHRRPGAGHAPSLASTLGNLAQIVHAQGTSTKQKLSIWRASPWLSRTGT